MRGVTTLIKPSSVNSQSVLADPLSNISVTPDTILDMSTVKITATLSCQSDNIPLASTQHSPTIEDLKVADLIRQIQDAEKIHLQIVCLINIIN